MRVQRDEKEDEMFTLFVSVGWYEETIRIQKDEDEDVEKEKVSTLYP